MHKDSKNEWQLSDPRSDGIGWSKDMESDFSLALVYVSARATSALAAQGWGERMCSDGACVGLKPWPSAHPVLLLPSTEGWQAWLCLGMGCSWAGHVLLKDTELWPFTRLPCPNPLRHFPQTAHTCTGSISSTTAPCLWNQSLCHVTSQPNRDVRWHITVFVHCPSHHVT